MDPLLAATTAAFNFISTLLAADARWPDLERAAYARQPFMAEPVHATRVALPALTCQCAGGASEQALPLTACWLLYDIASDIFDHVQDGDREGWPWDDWSPAHAINVGLGAVFAGDLCLARLGGEAAADVRERLARTALIGLQSQNRTHPATLETYLQTTIAKSGLIHAAIAWAGGRLVTDDAETLTALHEYGMAVGMMVQLGDDCRDLAGKRGDLAAGRHTLPLLYALSQTHHPQHRRLTVLLAGANAAREGLNAELETVLRDMGVDGFLWGMLDAYRQKAQAALDAFSSPAASLLAAYAQTLAEQP